ncbi:RtcB family protein [Marinobacter adhaerens]|uniref:3'-phosphate/5'-hydroxy nucleic acid ligase n=1 Tax=Marinobacter adhaerens TaxID=1033846 RepID=A0A851HYT8_9GAMM|nr:RtcB family protein [Marinobacter adhaerens]NWN91108.1 RtcB family protein [Marinobacter adhaerens]
MHTSAKAVIETEALPIKLWLAEEQMEAGALEQARNLANLPFAFRHIAIMPDTHQGYGMPIGAVLATKGAIVPNAVGVDIGCGMCSLRTTLEEIDADDLKAIMKIVRETVPVGFSHHDEPQDEAWMPRIKGELPIVSQEYERALYQVGTLGSGNHFIEIQKGSDGYIWIMIHSGSRNLGFTVANHYDDLAKQLNKDAGNEAPEGLAYLPESSEYFKLYQDEMNYCLEFALANRTLMMERVKAAFTEVVSDVGFADFINKPHNFAAEEKHFGETVIVHRKGATRARSGEWGMIPGSQGTRSFLVKGKGEAQSFESCSHGAGRIMSRSQARKRLDLKEEVDALKRQGILHAIRNRRDLDEAPGSYKDIDEVMQNQTDLVEVQVELQPLAVIKG